MFQHSFNPSVTSSHTSADFSSGNTPKTLQKGSWAARPARTVAYMSEGHKALSPGMLAHFAARERAVTNERNILEEIENRLQSAGHDLKQEATLAQFPAVTKMRTEIQQTERTLSKDLSQAITASANAKIEKCFEAAKLPLENLKTGFQPIGGSNNSYVLLLKGRENERLPAFSLLAKKVGDSYEPLSRADFTPQLTAGTRQGPRIDIGEFKRNIEDIQNQILQAVYAGGDKGITPEAGIKYLDSLAKDIRMLSKDLPRETSSKPTSASKSERAAIEKDLQKSADIRSTTRAHIASEALKDVLKTAQRPTEESIATNAAQEQGKLAIDKTNQQIKDATEKIKSDIKNNLKQTLLENLLGSKTLNDTQRGLLENFEQDPQTAIQKLKNSNDAYSKQLGKDLEKFESNLEKAATQKLADPKNPYSIQLNKIKADLEAQLESTLNTLKSDLEEKLQKKTNTQPQPSENPPSPQTTISFHGMMENLVQGLEDKKNVLRKDYQLKPPSTLQKLGNRVSQINFIGRKIAEVLEPLNPFETFGFFEAMGLRGKTASAQNQTPVATLNTNQAEARPAPASAQATPSTPPPPAQSEAFQGAANLYVQTFNDMQTLNTYLGEDTHIDTQIQSTRTILLSLTRIRSIV